VKTISVYLKVKKDDKYKQYKPSVTCTYLIFSTFGAEGTV